MITYVSYLRQSTIKQQVSRLGVDAQREIIKSYLGDTNPSWNALKRKVARRTTAPDYLKRLNYASVLIRSLSVLLDRLSRNVAFTSRLLESDVEIVFCDFPKVNRLLLHIVSSIAEYEASLISERTRLSLEVKKGQGAVLGKPENLLNNHSKAIANSVSPTGARPWKMKTTDGHPPWFSPCVRMEPHFFRWRISSIGKVSRTSWSRFTPAGVWRLPPICRKGRGDFGEETPFGSPLSGK